MRQRKVLFVCIGNSCRSQMAEGFARVYGSDVLVPKSAGLAPASIVQGLTYSVMSEKNIKLDQQYPKPLSEIGLAGFDLIVNMSGHELPMKTVVPVRTWKVEDPIGQSEDLYRKVRDELESLVMSVILEFRREAGGKKLERLTPRRAG